MNEDSRWGEDLPFTGAGYARKETTISCILTRFRLRSPWSLIPFYIGFRHVRRDGYGIAGLLKAVFLIENLRTCYTLSLWTDERAILDFSSRLRSHVTVANSSFGHLQTTDSGRPELWSAQFRLWAVSRHNLNWTGLDLRPFVADEPEGPEESDRTGMVVRSSQ